MTTPVQVLLCVLVADWFTGLVHWVEDTYGVPNWPLGIGSGVIEPNILHHEDPAHFTMSSVLMRNYQPALIAIGAIAIVAAFGWLTWQVAIVALLAAFGNEVHAWAHKRPKSRIVRLLQDMAIVQTPHQHAKHHKPPYDTYFCTLTNLLNPPLEAIRFWPALEWVVALFGVRPARMSAERRYV